MLIVMEKEAQTGHCPYLKTCPLFNGKLLKRESSARTYKNLYCNSTGRYKECKRYIVAQKAGKSADFVMPNSSYTVEEIIEKMRKDGLI